MKYKIYLYEQIPDGEKPSGIPDIWPANVEEVEDHYLAIDGEVVLSIDEYTDYINTNRPAYDNWLNISNLQNIKNTRFSQIDSKTTSLISNGFAYGEKIFSLSASAQNTLTGLFSIRDEPAITYPIAWNTIDDSDIYELQNSEDVKNFYLSAVSTYRTHLGQGTYLKNLIRAATNKEEIDNIIDNR